MPAWILLLILLFSSVAYSSPLEPFLRDPNIASSQSHQLSTRFNFPILLIEKSDPKLIDHLVLPQHPQKLEWLQRYYNGLSGNHQAGFSLKIPGEYLPCIISLPGSYQAHVETPALLEILTEYQYNPWAGKKSDFNKMVLFHEIGHCFENLPDEKSAERFADLFSILMLGASQQAIQQQLDGRFFSLLKGDEAHFSNHAIKDMAGNLPEIHEPLPIHHVVSLAMSYATSQQDLSQADRWVEYLRLHWAVMLDQQDLQIIGDSTADDMEALREQFIQRQQANLQQIYALDEQLSPEDYYQIETLLVSMVQQMLSVRLKRGELESQVQQGLFLADVSLIFKSYGIAPVQLDPNSPFLEQLNRLMAANHSSLAPPIRLPIELLDKLRD